jgi:two-component system sensor histidine kinase BaeS
LSSCHEEVLRITRLTNDLDKLATNDFSGMTLQISRFNLDVLVSRLCGAVAERLASRSLELVQDLVPAPICADQDRIGQMVMNLLDNAIKYSFDQGRIAIQLRPDKDGYLLSIQDNGPGIAPEHLPHIFERLYRIDPSRNRATGGSGLGLAIVQAIALAHGGRVEVESTVQTGSTFKVWLPSNQPGTCQNE